MTGRRPLDPDDLAPADLFDHITPELPMSTPTATAGANVRAEMARRKVNQATMAAHLGISQAAMSARLNGHTPFNINEVAAAAAYLEVGLAVLLDGAESEATAV